MSNRKYILGCFVALVALFTSCNNYLDKQPDSRQTIDSEEKASKLLVSAYPLAHPAYLFEMYSDNTDEHDNPSWTSADRFQEQAYYWKDITEIANQETPQQLWNTHYTAIATANEVLELADKPENKGKYVTQRGEALLCRAYSMFQLANIFCQAYNPLTASKELGLPYPTKPERTVKATYTRGTLDSLYVKIENDLLKGIELVDDNYEVPKMHFTPEAANAFAARFYLYYRKYDKAIDYATKVLGSNPESKLRDWASWDKLESNGQIQTNAYVKANQKANILLQVVASEWGAVNGPTIIGNRYSHGSLLSKTETLQAPGPWGDDGDGLNVSVWFANTLSKYILRKVPLSIKYVDIHAGTGMAYSEFAVFTADETLLTRAEAYALTGNYAAALNDVNTELLALSKKKVQLTLPQIQTYYAAVPYYTPKKPSIKKALHTDFSIDATTQEPLLQTILQLKRIVTLHEGLRLQDIKRYGITVYRRKLGTRNEVKEVTDSLTAGDLRLAIQLPQDVIAAGLQANPRKN